jgi:hypothetical protein
MAWDVELRLAVLGCTVFLKVIKNAESLASDQRGSKPIFGTSECSIEQEEASSPTLEVSHARETENTKYPAASQL